MFQPSHSKLWAVAAGFSQILYQENKICVFVESYKVKDWRDIARRGMHVLWLSQWWLKSVLFSNSYISFTLLYIMTSRARLHHVTNTRCVSLSAGDEPCSPVLDHFKTSIPKWWSLLTILSINMIWNIVSICLFYYNFHTKMGTGRWFE